VTSTTTTSSPKKQPAVTIKENSGLSPNASIDSSTAIHTDSNSHDHADTHHQEKSSSVDRDVNNAPAATYNTATDQDSDSEFNNESLDSVDDEDSAGNELALGIDTYSREDMKNLIISTLVNFTGGSSGGPSASVAAESLSATSQTSARCVVLCSLTCFIFDEIFNQKWNARRLNDAIRRIFKDLDFRDNYNPVLIKMSCDNLRFLSCLATTIFQRDIQYAINIINVRFYFIS
jgi:hypothetical protein